MANHDGTSQQENQSSSTERTPSGEQAPEQEEGRLIGQSEAEQSHQGMVPAQEAEHEQMSLQEHKVPQDEVSTLPDEALDPRAPTSDHQDDSIPGSAPEELPEREEVPVTSEPQGAADE